MRVSLLGLMLSLVLVICVLVVLGFVERTPLLNDGRATRLGAMTESLIMLLSSSIALKIFSSSALLGVAIAVLWTGFGVVELDWYLPPAVYSLLFRSAALLAGESLDAVLPNPIFYLGVTLSYTGSSA